MADHVTPDSQALVSCPMCAHRYDPAAGASCDSCPMHSGCALTCCPACGYSTVDPGRSALVGLGRRLARRLGLGRPDRAASTLAEIQPGRRAQVAALDDLPLARREQLAAYGLSAGRWVDVVQQSPVTVVRVEHIDLAFEADIARRVRVAPGDERTTPEA